MYVNYFKRIIDITVSIILLILLFPIITIVSVIIKLDSSGPILFKQKRVGKLLNMFVIYKFRTMYDEQRNVGNEPLIGKAEGVTNIGYYLRRFKIDEIPQLWNVFIGDMSLVGPRPSIKEQLVNMTDQEIKRYDVRPGITGLSQISGNIHLSWKKRYMYDIEYTSNITFMKDMLILLKTILIIFYGEDKFIKYK